MSQRVTLKDVASRVGVSYQTVSKVLNGQASVAYETEELIWQVINELGYTTNVNARNLRKSYSGLIGYSWAADREYVNPVLGHFLTSTVTTAEANGYHLMLFPTRPEPEQSNDYYSLIRTSRVDGFIITGTDYDDPRIKLLTDLKFPFVVFGRSNPEWEFAYVDVDGSAGLEVAVHHLAEQGHRRIAMLAWPEFSRVGAARLNGYLQGMAQAGLEINPAWIRRGAGEVSTGYRLTSELLALPIAERPTAIAAVDDRFATGAVLAAQAAGLQVGREFGVTGFDDSPGVAHLSPPLTSLRQPTWELGERAVLMLLDLIRGKNVEQRHVLVSPMLIVRASSQRDASRVDAIDYVL